MPDIIGRSAVEVAQFFLPLRLAVEDSEELAIFLRRFGLPVEVSQLATLTSSLTPLRQGVTTLLESAETALAQLLESPPGRSPRP